jgi:hypothetical protein
MSDSKQSLKLINNSHWFDFAIYINGMPKSGTTVLARLLDGHPNLFVLPKEPPLNFVIEGGENSTVQPRYCVASAQDALNRLKQYVGEKFTSMDSVVNAESAAECLIKELETHHEEFENTRDVYQLFCQAVSSCYGLSLSEVKGWGVKNVGDRGLREFFETFPQGRLVHISRDPRGFFLSRCESHMGKRRYPGGLIPGKGRYLYIYQTMSQWVQHEQEFMGLQHDFGPEKVVWVQYESLVSSPEEEMDRLLDALKLPHATQCYYPSNLGVRANTDTSHKNEKEGAGIYNTSKLRWQNSLPFTTRLIIDAMTWKTTTHFNLDVLSAPRPILRIAGVLLQTLKPVFRLVAHFRLRSFQKTALMRQVFQCDNGHKFLLKVPKEEPPVKECYYCQSSVTKIEESNIPH